MQGGIASGQEGRRRRGRPPSGAELVEGITRGSESARRRLGAILRTLSGDWTIEQAGRELGIGRSRFQAMRSRFLEEATALLEPRPPGPRRHVPSEAEREEDRVADLELELRAARVREELAAVLPRVLKPKAAAPPPAKKKRRTRRRRRRGR